MNTHRRIVALGAGLVSLGLAIGAVAQQSGTGAASGGASTQKSGSDAKGTPGAAKSSAGDARSAGKSDAKGGASSPLSGNDRTFVMKAAQGGMAEVELGKVAQERAANDAVKQFAQRMVNDHGKSNQELKSIASGKGVNLPGALDKQHQAHAEKMQRLKGPDFDREYMKMMVDDHRKTVADFEKASKNAKDADVRNFASKTLPTLQEHLKLAQSTHSQLKGAGKANTSASSSGSAAGGGGSMASGSGGAPGTGKSPATGGSGTSKDRTTGDDKAASGKDRAKP